VLEQFAYNGKLSKSMVEKLLGEHIHTTKTNRRVKHHRSEILAAIKFLKGEGSIKEINTDPGPGLAYGVGRPKTYFTITKDGMRKLMNDKDLTIHKIAYKYKKKFPLIFGKWKLLKKSFRSMAYDFYVVSKPDNFAHPNITGIYTEAWIQ
jgi:hypothetical protein